MNFTPQSDTELRATVPDGVYPATVVKAEDTTSKSSGNEMIALTLKVHVNDSGRFANDWILSDATWKIKQFCEASGRLDLYEAGNLSAQDCLGAELFVYVKTETQDGYEPQLRVKKYLKERPVSKHETPADIKKRQGVNPAQSKAARVADAEAGDDSIPF